MKNIILLLLLISASNISAQFDLPNLEDIESIELNAYWGDVTVLGGKRAKATIEINYTDGENRKREIASEEASKYVSIIRKGRTLEISAREPAGFESIDMTLMIPGRIQVSINHFKGGEIYLDRLENGLEVNQRNGSLVAENIREYAMINLANGSIDIEFDNIDPELPVSLVTLNGEVKVVLPGDVRRDVRFISEKNGYLISDFELRSVAAIPGLNRKIYSKVPIKGFGKINGGGSLLFMSTQNGPLILERN